VQKVRDIWPIGLPSQIEECLDVRIAITVVLIDNHAYGELYLATAMTPAGKVLATGRGIGELGAKNALSERLAARLREAG
jgi:hypothetical protein